jgi:hypothetical protein
MGHSNRFVIHWAFVGAEIILFGTAIVTAYLSQKNDWPKFTVVSLVSLLLFAVVKIVGAWPRSIELLAQDDLASRITTSAIDCGVVDYFNMRDSQNQARRNEATQTAIQAARTMWLCANSGASYLEPAIYRHWPFIERKLRDGIEFRVVLLDPLSDEKRFRNRLNVGGDAFDSKLNIANLVKLWNTFHTLDIRIVPYGMHATVFGTESVLFFDPYHVGTVENRIENRSFCLQICPTGQDGVDLYRLFKSHFETLWRTGRPFQDWFAASTAELPRGVPVLTR